MTTVLLVLHLMIAAALIAVVLLQRSEGGALGIGGGGGGGFMTGRGAANLLTRATAVLAAAFFATSIALTVIARHGTPQGSAIDRPAAGKLEPGKGTPSPTPKEAPKGGVLDKLQKE